MRSPIPVGRGLGFSGAMRVGGLRRRRRPARVRDADGVVAARPAVLELAIELEGHADNVAASLYGGVVATAAGRVVSRAAGARAGGRRVGPVVHDTSTQQVPRARSPATVSFADAVFNVGRTALLVAALAAGDVEALARGDGRPAAPGRAGSPPSPPSHVALADGLAAGAWCGWLSGSGPTVALLCDPADAADDSPPPCRPTATPRSSRIATTAATLA